MLMMTNLTTVVPASQARSNFYQLIEDVSEKFKHVAITLHGKSKAMVIPVEEYKSWVATVETLSNRQLMKDVVHAEAEKKRGELISEHRAKKELNW
jgi:prevent-host-death family protein